MIYMFGYGIQGRAHSLNLRDSGADITVINRRDEYWGLAVEDEFSVHESIYGLDVQDGDVLYILLPEEVHRDVLSSLMHLKEKNLTIVFAHGFSLIDKDMTLPSSWNQLMIAPRYPGAQVRQRFLDAFGVPAYICVHADASGNANEILNELCCYLGFDKGGVLEVSAREETLVDLAIEQVMAPSFFVFVQKLFGQLTDLGVNPEVAAMELYYSGETGAVRTAMSQFGLYEGLRKNASPTCQYGVASSAKYLNTQDWVDKYIQSRLKRITDGTFAEELAIPDMVKNTKSDFFTSEVANKLKAAEMSCDAVFKSAP